MGAGRGHVDALPRGALHLGRARRRARRACRTARSRASRSSSRCRAGRARSSAENVIAAWLDLEVASGNDAIASHSPIRKTAKLMGQFLPGTDFVTSGYSVMPRHDNTFGGGNYDADDLDEWLTIQRDWQVDGGIEPVGEAEVTRVRNRAALAIQAVFAELGLPPVTRRRGRPPRPPATTRATCPTATARPTSRRPTPRSRGRSRASRSRSRSTGAASTTSPARSSTCSASASRPTTSRPRP